MVQKKQTRGADTLLTMALKVPEVETADRILVAGQPEYERCNNMVTTSKYTLMSFLPVVSFIVEESTQIRHNQRIRKDAARINRNAISTYIPSMLRGVMQHHM